MSAGRTAGLDRRQLFALVRAYRTMGGRQPSGGLLPQRHKFGEVFGYVILALIGCGMGLVALTRPPVESFALLLHSLTLFFVLITALREADRLLFDPQDRDVLLYRPVHPSTRVAAKALGMLTSCLVLAGLLNLGPLFLGLLCPDAQPWFPLVHAASTALNTLFACGVALCSYGLMVRVLGRQRFKHVMTALQILLVLALVGGSQLLPRLLGSMDGALPTAPSGWKLALPPTWFAGFDRALSGAAADARTWSLAAAAIGITLLLVYLGVARIPDDQAEAEIAEVMTPRSGRVLRARRSWAERWPLRWWLRDPVERASFKLASAYLARERTLQVQIASACAMFLIFPLMSLFQRRAGAEMSFVWAYLASTTADAALLFLRSSSHPEAAEVFAVTPLHDRSALFQGARKAVVACCVVPLVLYASAFAIWGARADLGQLWLLAPAFAAIGPLSQLPGLAGDYVPLARAPNLGRRHERWWVSFLALLALGPFIGVLVLAREFGWLVPASALTCLVFLAIGRVLAARVRRAAAGQRWAQAG